ncbi:DivIVA domain-containing protein [Gryllotalpicola ginsengisoli]|uniref:DivIVA domain-containing protein n=1 Tax=Gryllotalpicola ginsengisoli TaxID=444608 RepID=UPI0003B46925|nr:DivIVA domain-containing protein [Gryllotalpicola ginsengisoli]
MAHFPTTGARRRGYDPEQVDRFLERARAVFDGREDGLTAADIRRTAFDLVRDGYDAATVDAALERLEDVFAGRERRAARRELGEKEWFGRARELAQVIVNRLNRPDRQKFTRAGFFTLGYNMAEVDRFSARLIRYFSEGKPITVEEVRTVAFRPQLGGYSEAQVDLLLDSVTDVMLAVR